MNITKKILLATLPFIILLGVVGLYLNVSSLQKQGAESLENIHTIMLSDKKEKLNDLVRNTFEILSAQYSAAHDNAKVAELYKQELESVVNIAYSSVEAIYKQEYLSDEAKKEQALKIIKEMRYAGGNYLWINDLAPNMVMHPIKPSLDGKDLSGFKDPSGKKLFVSMAEVCAAEGSGYVDYMWPKPGKDDPVPKLSYVKLFKPWGWVIGTGVYLEAAEQRFKEEAKKQISNLRFGPDGKDYFFIINTDTQMVMHPIKPSLNGNDLSDYRDENGKKLFVEMVKVGQSEGEGFVDYFWSKPGEEDSVPKLSFVKLFKEWGWIVGTGIYVDDIDKAMAVQENKVESLISTQRNLVIGISSTLVLVVGILIVFLTLRISAPIRSMNSMLRDIAEGEGDLTRRMEVQSKDELGEMAKWFNIFIGKLQGMVGYIAEESKQINSSSGALSGISTDLARGAQSTSDKSDNVAAAVEEMSTNMTSVATSMEETAANVNVVASAVEEMTSTITEIAQTSEKARNITEEAVGQAANASKSVDELGTAANEITGVLETISDISKQVDLLALNATIEAARAGDAGKGFAVVANEIKDLANQTAEATDQIKERIDSIQSTTTATVAEIENISKVVGENSEIVNTIATAVEEQSVTASEISKNVAQISIGIQEVNTNVSESSVVAADIAEDIADVNHAANEINDSSQNIDQNSQELRGLAQALEKLVSTYKY